MIKKIAFVVLFLCVRAFGNAVGFFQAGGMDLPYTVEGSVRYWASLEDMALGNDLGSSSYLSHDSGCVVGFYNVPCFVSASCTVTHDGVKKGYNFGTNSMPQGGVENFYFNWGLGVIIPSNPPVSSNSVWNYSLDVTMTGNNATFYIAAVVPPPLICADGNVSCPGEFSCNFGSTTSIIDSCFVDIMAGSGSNRTEILYRTVPFIFNQLTHAAIATLNFNYGGPPTNAPPPAVVPTNSLPPAPNPWDTPTNYVPPYNPSPTPGTPPPDHPIPIPPQPPGSSGPGGGGNVDLGWLGDVFKKVGEAIAKAVDDNAASTSNGLRSIGEALNTFGSNYTNGLNSIGEGLNNLGKTLNPGGVSSQPDLSGMPDDSGLPEIPETETGRQNVLVKASESRGWLSGWLGSFFKLKLPESIARNGCLIIPFGVEFCGASQLVCDFSNRAGTVEPVREFIASAMWVCGLFAGLYIVQKMFG